PGTLQELISQTMVHWAQESFIQSPELVRAMFSLLHRQYDGLGELVRALPKAYTISALSVPDTTALLECLGQIRSLLIVQMGPEEENLMIQSIGWAPSPCRGPHVKILVRGPHGEVPMVTSPCEVPMVTSPWRGPHGKSPCEVPMGTPHARSPWRDLHVKNLVRGPHEVPVSRSPWSPCEVPVPQVVTYLASCGLQSCPMLLSKGYPDIGWNPCGGERYLDFLRFAVFVNGEGSPPSPPWLLLKCVC
ncbi:RYR1 protein, partial [Glareola pratincola]|nr:RYR1 protein [Glareola pratincola]